MRFIRIVPALCILAALMTAAEFAAAQVPTNEAVENNAVEYDSRLCRNLGGELQKSDGDDSEVCSNLDANDTFCIVGEKSAFPCQGLFKHVILCNNPPYNRPALNPFFCGARCAGKNPLARGRNCEASIADLDAVVLRRPAALVAPGFSGPAYVVRASVGYELREFEWDSNVMRFLHGGTVNATVGGTVVLLQKVDNATEATLAAKALCDGCYPAFVTIVAAFAPFDLPRQPRPELQPGDEISGVSVAAPAGTSGAFSVIGAELNGAMLTMGALSADSATGELRGRLDAFGNYVVSVAYKSTIALGRPGHFPGTLILSLTLQSGGELLAPAANERRRIVSPTYAGSVAFFRGASGVTLTLAPNLAPPGFSIPAGVFAAPDGFTVSLTDALGSGAATVARFAVTALLAGGLETTLPLAVSVSAVALDARREIRARVGHPNLESGGTIAIFGDPYLNPVYTEIADPDNLFTLRADGRLLVESGPLTPLEFAPAVLTLMTRTESDSFLGALEWDLRVIVDFPPLGPLPPPATRFAMQASVAAANAGNDPVETKNHADSILRGFDRRLKGEEQAWESVDFRGPLLVEAIAAVSGKTAADAAAAKEILTDFYNFRVGPPPEGKTRFAHHNLLTLGITLTVEGVENILLGDNPAHPHNAYRQPTMIVAEYAGYHRGAHFVYTTGPRFSGGALMKRSGVFPDGYQENFCAAGGEGWRVITYDEVTGFRFYTREDDDSFVNEIEGYGKVAIGGLSNAPLPGAYASQRTIFPIFPTHPKAATVNLPSNLYGTAQLSEANSFNTAVFLDFFTEVTVAPTGLNAPLVYPPLNTNLSVRLRDENPDHDDLSARIMCVKADVDGEYDLPPPYSEARFRANGMQFQDEAGGQVGVIREVQATLLAGGGAFLTVTAVAYHAARDGLVDLPRQPLTVSLATALDVQMQVEEVEQNLGGLLKLILSSDSAAGGDAYILARTPRQLHAGDTEVLGNTYKGVYALRVRVSPPPSSAQAENADEVENAGEEGNVINAKRADAKRVGGSGSGS